MENFRLVVPMQVRFADVDGMVHVNNAVFATYFEHGRTEYFRKVRGLVRCTDFDFILARQEIDFLAPILLEDDVRLGIRVSEIGRTSFGFAYLLTRNGEAAARGRSVQVFYDYERRTKKPVPDDFRRAASEFEGVVFEERTRG